MPSKHKTWMPLYIADYLGDTMHLTAEQHGAYLLLLMAAWKRDGHVPDDDAQLAAITRTGERWQTHCAGIVRAFFTQGNGTLHHGRVEAELAVARDNVSKKSAAGLRGASVRWQKDGKRIADALPEQKQTHAPSPSPSPITSSLRSEVSTRAKSKQIPRPEDVDQQTWDDWLALRKAKKAPVTQMVTDRIRKEAQKEGWTLNDALTECVVRGWQSFKADWVKQKQTFAQQVADIARSTVPSRHNGPDPVLIQIEEERQKAVPMPEHIRQQISKVLRKA